jgi:hypothetical protein
MTRLIHFPNICATLVIALSLAVPAGAAPSHDWVPYSQEGLTVQYPRDVFSNAGPGDQGGSLFKTRDGRARLTIFTLRNDRGESPAQFLRRSFPENRKNLHYDRVAASFFAISENKSGRTLYRRCNFRSGSIHCINLEYPLREERAWDAIVTRISLSLRPR